MAARHKILAVGISLLLFLGLVQGKKDAESCKKMENNLRLLQLTGGATGGILSVAMIMELQKSLKKDCGGYNECVTRFHDCHKNAVCTDTKDSYKCTCYKGFEGDGKSCKDIDECSRNLVKCPNNTECHNNGGSYRCYCHRGYVGVQKDDGEGWACIKQDTDECSNPGLNSCGDNTKCENYDGGYFCACLVGFESVVKGVKKGKGLKCRDIDECANPSLNGCGKNTKCTNSPGSHVCTCAAGYEPTDKTNGKDLTCKDIDECKHSNLNTCGANAKCENNPGGFNCACESGFQLIAGTKTHDCKDIDECGNSNTCGKNTICKNYLGGYYCVCELGFEAENGKMQGHNLICNKDIDECKDPSLHLCTGQNLKCVNHPGGYSCKCAQGYEGNGIDCEESSHMQSSGECAKNPCHAKATCTDMKGSYKCKCKHGWKGDGKHCTRIRPVHAIGSGMFQLSLIPLFVSLLLGCLPLF